MTKFLQLGLSIISSALISIPLISNGQPYAPGKVIPPSPTASSLGQYGNINVGYYNGTPDISMPLYTIKTSNHSLDILLRYDASGVKVAQDASWVGLGWSLSAGGVITCSVRGLSDFALYNGFYTSQALPPSNDDGSYQYTNLTTWMNDRGYFQGMQDGGRDGEPDIFCFNFGQYAGKFVMGKQADGSIIYMADQNNLKVEYILASNAWLITDADGYKYSFGTKETATDYYALNSTYEFTDYWGKLNGFTYNNFNPSSTTAWYLDAITSPTGEIITFEYDRKESLSLISKAEQKYKMLSLNGGCVGDGGSTTPTFQNEYNRYSASRQLLSEPVLKKINFPLGSVEFTNTTREDIDYIDETKRPVKLSTIVLKDLNGNQVKKYEFTYSDFQDIQCSSYDCHRLKLDEIKEYGSDGSSNPPYKFTYRNPGQLPNKYTKAIDYWGFHNGKGNTSLLPAQLVSGVYLEGADREPDTEDLLAIDGTLTSITYPTGGHTDFEYELHDYYNLTADEKYRYERQGNNISSPSHGSVVTTTFTINYEQLVGFGFSYDPDDCTDCHTDLEIGYAVVEKDGQWVATFANQTPTAPDFISQKSMVLQPGTYTMYCYSIPGYTTYFGANWNERFEIPKRTGGGIRIKSITNYDNAGVASIRKFSYTKDDGSSSGKLLLHPFYSNTKLASYSVQAVSSGGLEYTCEFSAWYAARFSSTLNAVGLNSKSGIIGYDKVTETFGANGENGKIEYYFRNVEESVDPYPFMPTISDLKNGKLEKKIVYNAAGIPLQQTTYDYIFNSFASVKGVKVFVEPYYPDVMESFDNDQIRYYENSSAWLVLDGKTETTYPGTGTPISVSTNFYYDNPEHKNVTKQEVTADAHKKIITKFKYPSDYNTTSSSNSFVAKMRSQHIISPVIEQQTLVQRDGDTKLVSGSFNEYRLYNNSFYKPGTIYKLNAGMPLTDLTESSVNASDQISFHSAYQPESYLDAYTTLGNINQGHKAQDKLFSYIWDYKGTLPIAEIENASQSAVAYTSFEADGSGNWTISGGTVNNSDAMTGRKSYNLLSGNTIAKSGLDAGSYIVSYWVKGGPISVNNGSGTVKFIKNGWSYVEHIVSGTTITITGSATIDELRLYPVGAFMKTYTYDPLIGQTSTCDQNNRILYYEYDVFGRLMHIRDQDNNILKKYDYKYQEQQP